MSDAPDAAYLARFRRVLDHVDAHLDEALDVEGLARVAAFSRFHFHRQFSALYGVGVHEYVQLLRMKRAAYELAFRDRASVLQVALDCGYEGPEAFARAFRKHVGQSPSSFRKEPDWEAWQAAYHPISTLRSTHMSTPHQPGDVRLVDFPETRVGVLSHRGSPGRIAETIRRFIAWRRQVGLHPSRSATFNVFYSAPDAPPEAYRTDLCAATEGDIEGNAFGVEVGSIPGGRCAVLRHVGNDDPLAETARYLYAEWLPTSGEEPRDFPLFCRRVTFFPDVAEHEAVTEVFLPLR